MNRNAETRARSKEIAAAAVVETRRVLETDGRRAAEKVLVHAYHDGARALDIVEAWAATGELDR